MRIASTAELQEYAAAFVKQLDTQERATLVTLSGELGAGKTTFVQGIARALGVEETVSSPTFVLEKIYALPKRDLVGPFLGFKRLVHIDAYRLKGAHELEVLGWQELIADPANLILLEWPERVAEAIPESAIAIAFEIDGEERILRVHGEKG